MKLALISLLICTALTANAMKPASSYNSSTILEKDTIEQITIVSDNQIDPNQQLSLFFSSPEADIWQNKPDFIELLNKALNAKADPNEIKFFQKIPSVEIAKLLLKNKMNPNKFLMLVLSTYCGKYNHEKSVVEIDPGLIKQQINLIQIALTEKADPNKIEYFPELPSTEIAELLLTHKMDPNKFINLALFCKNSNNDPDFVNKQKELIKLAIKNNVDIKQIIYPEVQHAIYNNLSYIGCFNQSCLLKKIAEILERNCIETEKNYLMLVEKFKRSQGHCMGFTTL
ncbi:MAG TPA: hypothetical protein DCZ38_03815 [Coxiellaceae bacterium]|nr:hypothetical protein [Coxiellaceae bacterium]